jgi:hypothetical protein
LPVPHSPTSPLHAAPEDKGLTQRSEVRSQTPWHSALLAHTAPSGKRAAQVLVMGAQ